MGGGQSFRICSEFSQRRHAVITNEIRSWRVFLFLIDTCALLHRKSKKNKWLMNVLVVSEVSLCHPDCCHGSTQQCYHSEGLSTYFLFKDVGGLPGCQRHQLQGSNDFFEKTKPKGLDGWIGPGGEISLQKSYDVCGFQICIHVSQYCCRISCSVVFIKLVCF